MKAGLASGAAALLAVKRSGAAAARMSQPARRRGRGGGLRRCQEGGGRTCRRLGHSHRAIFRPGARDRQRTAQLRDRLPRQGRAQLPSRGRPQRHPRRGRVHRPRGRRDPAPVGPRLPGIGPATYSVGLVSGGRGGSTVADRCALTLDRRVLPTEDLDEAEKRGASSCSGASESERPGLSWETFPDRRLPAAQREGQRSRWKRSSRTSLADLGQAVTGARQGMRFATDAAWYEAAGCPGGRASAPVTSPSRISPTSTSPSPRWSLDEPRARTVRCAPLGLGDDRPSVVASSASTVTATAWTTEAILSASWIWSLPTPSSRSARS